MKAKRWVTLVTFLLTLVSFVLIIKFKNFECDVEYDIAMAIFGSSILGCIMSFTEYFSERERAMEQFYQEAIRTLAKFRKAKPLQLTEPEELIRNCIFEKMKNDDYVSFGMDDEVQYTEKVKYLEWLKKYKPEIFIGVGADEEKTYQTKIEEAETMIKDCIYNYSKLAHISFAKLDSAYGNLDFLVANHTIRMKAYNEIFDKMRSIRNEIFLANTHFELWKHGKGNFVFCTDKVIEINKKLFIEEKSEEENVVSVSIYQKEFDDIEKSLEKFRRKIYWGRSKDEVKRYPVGGRVLMRSKNDSGHIAQE